MKGVKEMGVTVQGVGTGRRVCSDISKNICGIVPGGTSVWVGDVGGDTAHWEGFGWIPT